MSDKKDDEKKRELKKNLFGLGLGLVIFLWFLYYLLSNIPD